MTRIVLPLLVASSLVWAAVGNAATRPHYGGTVHVSMRAAPASLDPAEPTQANSAATQNISCLIFDTLVTLDDRGQPQPALASSWQSESGGQRWQFTLRSGVKFHSGAAFTPDTAAASLRAANPTWKVFPTADSVVIEFDSPALDFPVKLGLQRNAIAKREGNKLFGTGPFAIADWQQGKKLTLTARDDYWGGRPFVDSIEIEMGRSLREQMISLDLSKVDVVEIAPEQAHRAAAEARHVESSASVELMALVFSRERQSPDDGKLREALALSIDRSSLNTVLLQGGGEPTGGLLPNWLSGYSFLFPVDSDLPRARQERDEVRQVPAWTLGYDSNDPVARVVAERISLNARDAGLTLQLTAANNADVRLMRIPLLSLDAGVALTSAATMLGLPEPKLIGTSAGDLYAAESALLQSQRLIPLLHLRTSYGVATSVKHWAQGPDGIWRMPDVWLGTDKP
jgi:peptide/nickel transport system substrate-binding protein